MELSHFPSPSAKASLLEQVRYAIRLRHYSIRTEEEISWEPDSKRIPAKKIVKVKVAYGEIEVGRTVRRAGGKWNREEKVWEVPYVHVVNLGLQSRLKGDRNVHY